MRDLIINNFTTIVVAFIGASWFYKEKKRKKLEMYENLIENFTNFQENSLDSDGINEFINQFRLSYMYGSAEVIRAIDNFLACVHTEASLEIRKKKEEVARAVFIAIRKGTYYSLFNIPLINKIFNISCVNKLPLTDSLLFKSNKNNINL